MGKKLFAIFTIVPLIELALLVVLGDAMGLAATLALVFATGLAGAYLAKREGLRVLRSWQESIARAAIPTDGIMSGVLVLVGGIFLVTPGVLTDVLGISLLLPPSRRAIAKVVKGYLAKQIESGDLQVRGSLGSAMGSGIGFGFGGDASDERGDDIIEVSSRRVDDTRPPN